MTRQGSREWLAKNPVFDASIGSCVRTFVARTQHCRKYPQTYTTMLVASFSRFCLPKAVRLGFGQLQFSPDILQVSGGAQNAHCIETLSYISVSIEPLVVYDSQSAVAIVDFRDCEELVTLAHDERSCGKISSD
jgi:hypothetical protein